MKYYIAIVLLAIFAVNVCIGKYRLWSETGTAAPLDGVPEFLLLLATVALFISATISAANKQRGKD